MGLLNYRILYTNLDFKKIKKKVFRFKWFTLVKYLHFLEQASEQDFRIENWMQKPSREESKFSLGIEGVIIVLLIYL